jgi:signal transduction histidine kinase
MATYLSWRVPVPRHWIVAGEASLATLLVFLGLPDSLLLLPYLVLLPLISGLSHGVTGATVAIAAQFLSVLTLTVPRIGLESLGPQMQLLAPWTLTIVGSGLLGAWTRKLGKTPGLKDTEVAYESARQLLGQLRSLARELTSGLDPFAVAAELLELTHATTQDSNSALFVETSGGVLVPLAYRGPSACERLVMDSRLISGVEHDPVFRDTGIMTDTGARVYVAPLPVGSSATGVIVCEVASHLASIEAQELTRDVREMAIRLDTALAFDELRTLVTVDERHRLAREIHDGIAQEVASLGYMLDDITATANEPSVREPLGNLRQELTRLVSELRLSIFDLRTDVGTTAGLGSAISDYVRKFGSESVATVHLTLDEAPTRLPPGVEMQLFRIVQEAITNVRKHADADNVWVNCNVQPPHAIIEVRDDGRGLRRGRPDSYGLRIMRERAERIGATLRVEPGGPGTTGTRVTVALTGGASRPATRAGGMTR